MGEGEPIKPWQEEGRFLSARNRKRLKNILVGIGAFSAAAILAALVVLG